MGVKVDSSAFKARMARLQTEFSSSRAGSIADSSAEDMATQMLFKYRTLANQVYRFDTQVGITRDAFNTAISGVNKIGDSTYGILNVRAMGSEKDISKIANIPGLWHQGHRAFDSFKLKVLNSANKTASLKTLRDAYWGFKVPQWIYLEFGDSGTGGGNLTPPGLALTYTKDPKYVWRRWVSSVKNKFRSARI